VAARALARRALIDVGFDESRVDRDAADLTFGERKLVDVARALVGGPRLILMDEPTAGLEESEIGVLTEAIARLKEGSAVTIVLIAHHIGFVRDVADFALLLDTGRVFASGKPEELMARPDVIEVFVGGAHA
jgi:branched-chain amino acid transport system permease protein